jgi:ABC-type transport system substrate-binding protein
MSKIGINVVLEKLDYNSLINRMIKGEAPLFSMFVEYVFSSPEPILINLFSTSKIPVPNFFQFSNPSVDKMLEELYNLKDEREAVRYSAEIESKVMDDVPAIFLYRQKYVILYSNNMEGLELSGNNHYFFENLRFIK